MVCDTDQGSTGNGAQRIDAVTASASDGPPIYLLPGMTREYPVFARLIPLLRNATVIQLIDPEHHESLRSYAARMSKHLSPDGYLVGVSFGGIVAAEVSRIIRPQGCVLVSSVCGPHQLPPWLRVCRMIGRRHGAAILNMVGHAAGVVPRRVGSRSIIRLGKLSGTKGAWHRWATSAVLDWQPDPRPFDFPVLQIHGDADRTFPIRYIGADVVVSGGGHALPMSHPNDTAYAIVAFTSTISQAGR